MNSEPHEVGTAHIEPAPSANAFSAHDVAEILHKHGWLAAPESAPDTLPAALLNWMENAAALLGQHASNRNALADLVDLIFHYDAPTSLATPDAKNVMARAGSREVIRELANLVLDNTTIDSERFKTIVEALKAATRYRSRELFHPIRLALAGRVGEGELDRVILLLDAAATLPFVIRVKGTRERMLEFCAALE
jgi:glutamyl/glutaminyl-tRNA synthetase